MARLSLKTDETAEQRIERLMVRIILTEPFFAILLLRLKRVETTAVQTAGTDGEELLYNPAWIMSLKDEHAHFILLHEIMHCVFNHTTRRGNRDPRLWNIAGDHVINLELIGYGYKMPPGGLADNKYEGMTTDQVYAELAREQLQRQQQQQQDSDDDGQQGGQNPGQPSGQQESSAASAPDPGRCGGVGDAPAVAEGPAETAEHEATWQQAVQQAAQIAKSQGKLPAGMERLVAEVLRPVVNWRDVLRDFCTQAARDDYSWSKPNRRFISQRLYLPSQSSDGSMDSFAIAVDTSGSMSDRDMSQFAGEITAIMEDLKPPQVEVIYCDAQVGNRQTFTQEDLPLAMKPTGGGGTSFAPVMAEIAKLDDEPACLVYFTDMYCDDFGKDPGVPVLWIVTSNGDHKRKPPFGRVVHMAN